MTTPIDQDEPLLHMLRVETKTFLQAIAARADLLQPVLEVGPMTKEGAASGVFARMPETFVDSPRLFQDAGWEYMSLDIDPSANPTRVGDVTMADKLFPPASIGTAILLSCLEHVPRVWDVPRVLQQILKPGGRAFILTPWNLRFHGPRPDCWRISDDGYRALFADGFEIEALEQIECPGRPLMPVGMKCVIRKPA